LLSLLLFPALCFLTVSLLQKLVKRKRPYENGVQPLVPKNAYGNSFPSRHSACAFVIATTALPYFPLLGGALFAVGAWITFFRFLFGHHYFTDLLCGSALGVGFGLLGMVL
jgi:membrane-associated phospholipid phosphatase